MPDSYVSYARGRLSAEQLKSEISHFWHELECNGVSTSELDAHGIHCEKFTSISTNQRIMVTIGRSGVDPTETVLIVAFAPTANRILKDIWETTLLPRIRRRWGEDALGKRKEENQEDTTS